MVQTLPTTLLDGSGFIWDIQDDGRIADGTADAFDAGIDNPDLRVVQQADTELDGRQLVLKAGTAISDPFVSLERRIYIPTDQPWARFLDTATNTSDVTQTYTIRIQTNFGSDASSQVRASSSGDLVFDTSDLFVINDDSMDMAGDPQVALAFGDGRLAASIAQYTSTDIAEYAFTVTLAPGQSATVMSFAAQSHDGDALAALAATLSAAPTPAMEYGIPHWLAQTVVNYDVIGFYEQTAYFGNDFADVLRGSDRDESFDARDGNDVILAAGGADSVNAGYGDDVVAAGEGADRVTGGGGHDVLQGEGGADVVFGDGVAQRKSVSHNVTETGQTLALSVAVPDASDTGTIWLEGEVTRQPLFDGGLNLLYVVDMSSTMASVATGVGSVGDRNGDGTSNQWIDVALAGLDAISQQLVLNGYGASDLSIIAYNSDAEAVHRGAIGGQGLDVFTSLMPAGNTSFEAPLQAAISALAEMGAGENHIVFLSDGAPSDGATFSDEVATLTDPNGLNAQITAIGLGDLASLFHLDLLDDGAINGTAHQLLDSTDFFPAVFANPVDVSELDRVEILVNGVIRKTLGSADFVVTDFGVRFQTDVSGLVLEDDDTLTVRLVASDSAATVLGVTFDIPDTPEGSGDDTLSGGAGHDVLTGNAGNDVLLGDKGHDVADGGRGDDHLIGSEGNDVLLGGLGDDVLQGGSGADTLIGGAGDDVVSYAGSNVGVIVDLTAQTASGGDADGDVLSGITGVDGTAQRDVLIGTADPNRFRPGLGDDDVFGDANFDLVDYSDLNGSIYITLQIQGGAQDGWAAGFDYLNNIDGLVGTQFDDYLIGDSSYNEFYGGAGRDVIKSKGGNDRLDGGAGDDKITGDTGHEIILGGTGDDEIYGLTGMDTLYGGSGADYISGGKDADEIFGQGGADTLRGNIGFDTIYGGRGADDIRGGGGGDLIYGEQGDDFILGENGSDTLSGGAGSDVLQGNGGTDVFLFEPGMAFDEARDFIQGEDRLDVSAFGLSDLTDVMGIAVDRSSGLRLEFGGSDVAFITGVAASDLNSSDFIF